MSNTNKIQLQICGNSGVFDYLISGDSFIAATKNTISVHPLDYSGSPRQQLDYDIGVIPFAACVQQHQNQTAFATVDKRQLAIWDIVTSSLSESFTNPGLKEDEWSSFVWSVKNPGEFFTGSRHGVVSMWDRRTDEHALHTCLIPNKRISKVIWSTHHEHTVLIKAEANHLVSLDLRMLTNSSDASNHENRKRVLSWTKTAFPIMDFVVRDAFDNVLLLYNNFSLQQLNFVDHKLSNTISYPSLDAYIQQDFHPHSLYINESSDHAVMICRDNDRQQSRSVLFALQTTTTKNTDYASSSSPSTTNYLPLTVEDTEKINEPVQSCFWRGSSSGQQHKLMAVTPSGTVHFVHANKPDENTTIISSCFPRYSHNNLKSILTVSLPGERLWADQSPRELLTTPLAAVNHLARMTMSTSSVNLSLASSSSTTRTVVGPLRFRLLLLDEIRVLEYALKSRLLEGLLLSSINEFTRTIVLECSLQPTSSGYGGYSRHLSSASIQQQLLNSLNNINEVAQQSIIVVVLTFPKKLSNFWQGLTFSLENRSSKALDMDELKTEILAEIQPVILDLSKAKHAAAVSASASVASNTAASTASLSTLASIPGGPLTPSTGHRLLSHNTSRNIDMSSYLLYNVSKMIRDKIHAYCEKVQFQRQQSLSTSKSQSMTRDSSSDDNELADYNTTASSHYSISKKHRVPFPCLSAGIFSATGRLCLFGNAILIVDEHEDFSRRMNFSEAIEHIPTKLYTSPIAPPTTTTESSDEKKEEENKAQHNHHNYRHQSLAQLMRHHIMLSTVQKSNKIPSPKAVVAASKSERVSSPVGGIKSIARAVSNEDYAVAMVEVTSSDTLSITIPAADPAPPTIIRPITSPTMFTNFSAMTTMATAIAITTATRTDELKPPSNVFALLPSLLPKEVALASKYIYLPVVADSAQRVLACHQNADTVKTLLPSRRDLHQFWVLLGVAMDVLDMGKDNPLCDDPLSWSNGALGRSIIAQLFQEVVKLGILTASSAVSIIGGLERLSSLCAWTEGASDHQQQQLQWTLRLALQQLRQWDHPIVAAMICKLIPQQSLESSRESLNFSTLCQPCDEAEAKIAAVATSPLLGGSGGGSSKNLRKRMKAKSKRVGSGKDTFFSASGDGISSSIPSRAVNVRCRSEVLATTTVSSSLPQQRCNISSLICCVCQDSVAQQSLVAVCMWCGHGGHDSHMQEWFDNLEECPLGCGCCCRSLLALPAEVGNATNNEDDNAPPQDISAHSGRFFQTMFATSSDAWNI